MKGFKVVISEYSENSTCYDYSEIFSGLESALDYVLDYQSNIHSDLNFRVSVIPVELKVKYQWSEEFDDK